MSRLLPALLAFLATGLAQAQTRDLTTSGVLLDRVAAVVNDGVVLSSELDEQMVAVTERLRAQNLELPPESVLRQQVLERLVVQELQMQRAQRAGLKVPDDALNEALGQVAQRNQIALSRLPEALAAQGIDYASYRESMRKELTRSLLMQRDVYQHITVTPREVDQYIERQKNAPVESAEYNVSHILIAVPQAATPEQLEEAGQRAKDVFDRASGGEDFARLAVAYSNSQKALEGGSLGWLKGSQVPTFLTETVARLEAGEVSEPMRTPTGYHIVKLNEVRNAGAQTQIVDQVHARHILMKTTEIADDATVRQKLADIRERIVKGEDFAGLASTTSEDPGSASQGGDLGWTGQGAFVPEFEQAINALAENEISEPFRTQYGWHIVQLLGKRQFDSTDTMKRRQVAEAIRNSRVDEETELWLRRLRDEAFVEYKL
jgi:peptidyl-prolyl cis-trans isomerase SurA